MRRVKKVWVLSSEFWVRAGRKERDGQGFKVRSSRNSELKTQNFELPVSLTIQPVLSMRGPTRFRITSDAIFISLAGISLMTALVS